ncbi:MAG TPA: polynucleotide adenylyltransferase PcnB [Gammaproteobacteria bacterium]|jgi:poly(A) polymerase|nr:polynucleotide adenylyltransferase PcnB [Gammaproteobacteria bacterium]
MNPKRQRTHFEKKLIDKDALKVLKVLHKAKFEAYLVGGCIRDLLLGQKPKDFDIATNATPEQVHKLFKRSRLIGRRFPLVHIMFSARKYIEVATFRAPHSHINKGSVVRDNHYGTLKEDVFRRDFTVNALYYDINKSQVIDFVDGLKAINERKICMIGNPINRFEEDPVRMIRAIRFEVKLEAKLDPEISKVISKQSHLLSGIPPARLYDECIKLFHNEKSYRVFERLLETGLLKYLFQQTNDSKFIKKALNNTSERLKSNKSVTPAFLFSVFLWDSQNKYFDKLKKKNKSNFVAMNEASEEVIRRQVKQVLMPKWLSARVKDTWMMQHQLEKCNSKKVAHLITNPRFRMAYDFLVLRSQSINPELSNRAKYWTQIQK